MWQRNEAKNKKRPANSTLICYTQVEAPRWNNKHASTGHFVTMIITGPTRIYWVPLDVVPYYARIENLSEHHIYLSPALPFTLLLNNG